MNQMLVSLTDKVVQCWGCAVFDRLFQVVSTIGVEIYNSLTQICLAIFGLLFAIFVFNAIWKNFKGGLKDPIMKDSFLKAFIRAVFALTLLGAGTLVPKTISTVIFEPVTKITLLYSQSMINTTDEIVSDKVKYEPIEIMAHCIQYKLDKSYEAYFNDILKSVWNLNGKDPIKILKQIDK